LSRGIYTQNITFYEGGIGTSNSVLDYFGNFSLLGQRVVVDDIISMKKIHLDNYSGLFIVDVSDGVNNYSQKIYLN